MKIRSLITSILLSLLVTSSYAQDWSVQCDSLTNKVLSRHAEEERDLYAFTQLLKYRKTSEIATHLDTTSGNYVFLIEQFSFLDSSISIKEEYFFVGDSVPKIIYVNDSLVNTQDLYSSIFNRETKRIQKEELFNPKILKHKAFKPFQELNYDKVQVREHGCVDSKAAENSFRKQRIKELKNTYMIYTMIDKKSKQITISLQYAPKKPTFSIEGYNLVWDF